MIVAFILGFLFFPVSLLGIAYIIDLYDTFYLWKVNNDNEKHR